MRITVLGGSGGWPAAGGGCSGYLVEAAGFRLLVDPGYGTVPRLLGLLPASAVDAVLVTHGHPDHCADLNPLLRARVLPGGSGVLPVFCPPGAVDRVLALDAPPMLAGSYALSDLSAAAEIGPFAVRAVPLPHFVPDLGVRLAAGDASLAYTGDSAPDDAVVELARDASVLLAEASFADTVPEKQRSGLSTAASRGVEAAAAGVGRLVLTHLFPVTDHAAARAAAAGSYSGPIDVAEPGRVVPAGRAG
jgi:ribonuclease BN (tRNA processing enzyme)